VKQGIMPLIPSGKTNIFGIHSVFSGEENVTWLQGIHPIRAHPVSARAIRRAMMGFPHLHGGVAQPRIAAALRVHENTVRAAVNLCRREGGVAGNLPDAERTNRSVDHGGAYDRS